MAIARTALSICVEFAIWTATASSLGKSNDTTALACRSGNHHPQLAGDSTVDDQRLSSDEAGCVRQQKLDCADDILRPSQSSQRCSPDNLVALTRIQPVRHFRFQIARGN